MRNYFCERRDKWVESTESSWHLNLKEAYPFMTIKKTVLAEEPDQATELGK